MSKLRSRLAISLDGYVAGPNQSLANPLGEGGMQLHEWAFPTKTFNAMHGGTDGETGVNDDVLRDSFANVGASILGRNMFGPVRDDWGDHTWRGWWGNNPPYHHPVFVLTHHARDSIVMEGGTTFYFVTDGIASALKQAQAAANGRDVSLGGGAQTVRQYLQAGLIDELELHLVPRLLGAGERLFDHLGNVPPTFELTRTLEGRGVTHLKYRIIKPAKA